jgi:uncharacterized membrane protein
MLLSAIIFTSVDFIYLNVFKNYFDKQIQLVQGSQTKFNFLGAILCYIFLIVGINYFIIKPRKSVSEAFLLGIVIYGVYETTSLGVFKEWSVKMAVIDILWGGILFALTKAISTFLKLE